MTPEEEEAHVQYLLDNFDSIRNSFASIPGDTPDENISYEISEPAVTERIQWPVDRRRPSKRYMKKREPQPACSVCGCHHLQKDTHHGDLVCTLCGVCHPDSLTDEAFKNLNYDEYGKLRSFYDSSQKRNTYKKGNYFNETLKQLTGDLEVPSLRTIWDTVRFQDYMTTPVSAPDIRVVLKRHKLHRFYKYAASLATLVNRAEGNHVPRPLDHHEEDLMKHLFEKFNKAFSGIRGQRKNSLSYGYVTIQLLRLINRDDLCENISTIKCKTRLHHHDATWKRICEASGWQYIPYLI